MRHVERTAAAGAGSGAQALPTAPPSCSEERKHTQCTNDMQVGDDCSGLRFTCEPTLATFSLTIT